MKAYSMNELCEMVSLSKPSIYNELKAQRLRSFKVGDKRLFSEEAINDWIRLCEANEPPMVERQNIFLTPEQA